MFIFQIIAIVFGLFMMYVVRIHRKKSHLDSFEFGMWMALWAAFMFLSIFPQLVTGIAQTLHFARVFDLLIVVAFMVIIAFTFFNRIETKKLEKKFEELIRRRALHAKE